jgi:hypothetical protein
MNRKSAQERVNRMQAFQAELDELEREGVLALTDAERSAVASHHARVASELKRDFDIDTNADAENLSLAMKIASALGALAMCLAVGLFFEQIWGKLSTPAHVALLASAPLAAVGLMELAAKRERTHYVTAVLSAVAIAAFIVNVQQLGAMFSMRPSPMAMGLWSAFAMLLAYRYRLRLPLVAGLVMLIAFLAMIPLWVAGFEWENPFQRPELVIGAAALIYLFANREKEDFAEMFRLCGAAAVLAGLFTNSIWGLGTFLPFGRRATEAIYTVVFIAVSAAWIGLAIRNRWTWLTYLASGFFAIFLFAKMYDWFWQLLPSYVFFALIGLLSLGLIAAFRRMRGAM